MTQRKRRRAVAPCLQSALQRLLRAALIGAGPAMLDITLLRNIPVYEEISESDRVRQTLGLKPHVRIALYQGNIQSNRRLDRLVEAASFLEPALTL